MSDGDTIYALSTAPGRAGIAVVRLSGPRPRRRWRALAGTRAAAAPCAARAVSRSRERRRRSTTAWRCFFPRRASVTGEDVAELHVHGSRAVVAALFEALAPPGIAPGRARRVHAPRLPQRQARSHRGRRRSPISSRRKPRRSGARRCGSSTGALGRLAEGWRARLLRAQARLEAAIDFPDEDLPAGLMGGGARGGAALARRDRRASRRRASRRAAARRRGGRDPRAAQCRQVEPDERAGAARRGDHRSHAPARRAT